LGSGKGGLEVLMVFKKMMKTIKTIKTSKTTFLSFPSLPLFPKHLGSARQPLTSTSRGPPKRGCAPRLVLLDEKILWGLDEVNKISFFQKIVSRCEAPTEPLKVFFKVNPCKGFTSLKNFNPVRFSEVLAVFFEQKFFT